MSDKEKTEPDVEKQPVLIEIRGVAGTGKTALAALVIHQLKLAGIEVSLDDEEYVSAETLMAAQHEVLERIPAFKNKIRVHVVTQQVKAPVPKKSR
jgi:adenylylsulfate kinase-like enzyme